MKKRRKERGCCQNQRQAGCPSQQASPAGAGYAAKNSYRIGQILIQLFSRTNTKTTVVMGNYKNTNTTVVMDKYEYKSWAKSVIFGSTVDGWRLICRFYSLKTELFSQFFWPCSNLLLVLFSKCSKHPLKSYWARPLIQHTNNLWNLAGNGARFAKFKGMSRKLLKSAAILSCNAISPVLAWDAILSQPEMALTRSHSHSFPIIIY